MIERHLRSALLEALADRPVVLVNGARQVGKSTLVQSLMDGLPAQYLTLDDSTVLAAAQDPAGFIAGLPGSVILDEVQRAPDLFLAIKASVDRDRRPGRFLLTGSADVFFLPRILALPPVGALARSGGVARRGLTLPRAGVLTEREVQVCSSARRGGTRARKARIGGKIS